MALQIHRTRYEYTLWNTYRATALQSAMGDSTVNGFCVVRRPVAYSSEGEDTY